MKFKVGDKVRLTREITQDDLAEIPILLHAYEVIIFFFSINQSFVISGIDISEIIPA